MTPQIVFGSPEANEIARQNHSGTRPDDLAVLIWINRVSGHEFTMGQTEVMTLGLDGYVPARITGAGYDRRGAWIKVRSYADGTRKVRPDQVSPAGRK